VQQHQQQQQQTNGQQQPQPMTGSTTQQPSRFRVPGKRAPVSRLVFGTLRLHETARPLELLDEAWRLGIRAFDTARVYGDGECERVLGEWVRSRAATGAIALDDLTVITKGGCGAASAFWRPDLDPDALRRELDTSLDRLGVDAVDVYVLHRDQLDRPVGEICRTMQSFLDDGLIRAWGVSNWHTDRIEEAMRYATAHRLEPPACSSLQDSLATPAREPWPGTVFMDDAQRAWYARNPSVAVLGWETLGKGFLAGRWSRRDAQDSHDTTDVYSNEWREMRLKGAYLTDDNFARRDRAARFAEAKGYRAEHAAIAWCLAQPYESHVITATVNPDHLRSNVRALSLRLAPQDVDWLATGDAGVALPPPSAPRSSPRTPTPLIDYLAEAAAAAPRADAPVKDRVR